VQAFVGFDTVLFFLSSLYEGYIVQSEPLALCPRLSHCIFT
jgi:hypothetical protein